MTKNNIKSYSSTDDSSTNWVSFTTKLADASNDEWVLSNDVTFIKAPALTSTHVTGLGCNNNFSVVKDSEYLRHNYTLYSLDLGIYEEGLEDYIWSANAGKDSNGYAFYFDLVNTEIQNTAFTALLITPNVTNTKIVDGHGHYAKYSQSVVPNISFSSSGASISLSPSSHVSKAPSTHVQLRAN